MPLKVWNGSSWASATGLKVWNGSSWVTASNGKVWNGSAWTSFFSPSSGILINDHELIASVGSVFNGAAVATLTFYGTGLDRGKLFYDVNVTTGADPNRYVEFWTNGSLTASGETTLSGQVTGSWITDSTLPSAYEIYVSKTGDFCSISGASFNTWTNMQAIIALSVSTAVNDAIDQTFNVQIRRASDLQVLDTATIVMQVLAAGIN